MGLPSFDSGDRRRVRVTSRNKRTKKYRAGPQDQI